LSVVVVVVVVTTSPNNYHTHNPTTATHCEDEELRHALTSKLAVDPRTPTTATLLGFCIGSARNAITRQAENTLASVQIHTAVVAHAVE
jgi:hypothetical protein